MILLIVGFLIGYFFALVIEGVIQAWVERRYAERIGGTWFYDRKRKRWQWAGKL